MPGQWNGVLAPPPPKKKDLLTVHFFVPSFLHCIIIFSYTYLCIYFNRVHLNSFCFILFCRLVYEDNEHGLFTVTLFKKVVDEFKLHARDKKLVKLIV